MQRNNCKKIILIIITVLCLSGCKKNSENKIFDLPIEYKSIELVISRSMPEGGNLVCCADFTTDFNLFKSPKKRLVYSCVSKGKLYEKKSPKNIGVFTWYNNRYHFSYNKQDLKNAADNNGMGFLQWMVIYNYKPCKIKTVKSKNHFRVLAELNGKLHFIEASEKMRMTEFVDELVKMKVKYAIYLDTGKGWETFYYRENGKKIIKHNTVFPFRTNYLYFK